MKIQQFLFFISLFLIISILYFKSEIHNKEPIAHMKINSDCFISVYNKCASKYKTRDIFERSQIHDKCLHISEIKCKEDDYEFLRSYE